MDGLVAEGAFVAVCWGGLLVGVLVGVGAGGTNRASRKRPREKIVRARA